MNIKTFETMSNGTSNGCEHNGPLQWPVGLLNSKFKYLTAETFGFKINANGTSLKKKQMWTLEAFGSDGAVCLRSHLDKILAVDQYGNVTCENDEKDNGCKFHITVADDGSGRWAFRNEVRGYYLAASADKLMCTGKVPSDAEYWTVHLAARPQVNIRSVGRRRFARLSDNMDEIHVDANVPWGKDTLFTLEFRSDKYAIHTCNNKYLAPDGKLVDSCLKECLFTVEFHNGNLALRDKVGQYLSPIGAKAILRTRSQTVTKDELFTLEEALPQASFVSFKNKYVSVKQGVDVTANQDEISDYETFQLEFDAATKRWYIRTMQDKYWTLQSGGAIQANSDRGSSNDLFDLSWQSDGSVAFRANNGKYVAAKKSGHLFANSEVIDENSKFYFYLINRPILVLKCEQGYVGYKSASSARLECNKATYETIQVETGEKGACYFKGVNNMYWRPDGDGSIIADSENPEPFYLELRDPTKMCIKNGCGEYIVAEKNGVFRIGGGDATNSTLWEY